MEKSRKGGGKRTKNCGENGKRGRGHWSLGWNGREKGRRKKKMKKERSCWEERERGGGCLYGSFKRENFNLPHGNHEFPETIPQPLEENNSAT